jgi:hypothetical protein
MRYRPGVSPPSQAGKRRARATNRKDSSAFHTTRQSGPERTREQEIKKAAAVIVQSQSRAEQRQTQATKPNQQRHANVHEEDQNRPDRTTRMRKGETKEISMSGVSFQTNCFQKGNKACLLTCSGTRPTIHIHVYVCMDVYGVGCNQKEVMIVEKKIKTVINKVSPIQKEKNPKPSNGGYIKLPKATGEIIKEKTKKRKRLRRLDFCF